MLVLGRVHHMVVKTPMKTLQVLWIKLVHSLPSPTIGFLLNIRFISGHFFKDSFSSLGTIPFQKYFLKMILPKLEHVSFLEDSATLGLLRINDINVRRK